ncbi:unnamed protein product [Laminaria digitata]
METSKVGASVSFHQLPSQLPSPELPRPYTVEAWSSFHSFHTPWPSSTYSLPLPTSFINFHSRFHMTPHTASETSIIRPSINFHKHPQVSEISSNFHITSPTFVYFPLLPTSIY